MLAMSRRNNGGSLVDSDTSIKTCQPGEWLLTSAGLVSADRTCVCVCACVCECTVGMHECMCACMQMCACVCASAWTLVRIQGPCPRHLNLMGHGRNL
jgi:hypothetical protein